MSIYKDVEKIHQERADNTYRCVCGNSLVIRSTDDEKLCKKCGRLVKKKDLVNVEVAGLADRIRRHFEKRRRKE